ncbi:NAD(P)-dependent oxidoreductase [Mangrovicoccus ximenensis]|uniref:NAD(P)-dependent oxidoreductase n=1 Tax=Mangrovicoccus ximenensis TaxID=1911570 RepID=UPI000D39EA63
MPAAKPQGAASSTQGHRSPPATSRMAEPSRRIAGAGLDVFEDEPHPHPGLLALPNVVLTPHTGSATWRTRRIMADLMLANLRAHLAGEPLKSPVT